MTENVGVKYVQQISENMSVAGTVYGKVQLVKDIL